jgi:ubiquinone/menaquinone biosynthesis C-methylase UbiE
MKENEIKKTVKEGYAKIAKDESTCCPPATKLPGEATLAGHYGETIGYSQEELHSVPEGANLGLGCGNPVALASLQEGEAVLDLGAGAGLDCFLAAQKVGKTGKVIGVDMTPEMVEKARSSADKGGYTNVEFRLGEIENLPVANLSIDAVISNCVINLSPDKKRVFKEAFRVLKPGGRIMISDIVLTRELPALIKESVAGYIGCVSGAMMRDEYLGCIEAAGFQTIKVIDETPFPFDCLINDPTAKAIIEDARITTEEAKEIAGTIVSLKVQGCKVNLHPASLGTSQKYFID